MRETKLKKNQNGGMADKLDQVQLGLLVLLVLFLWRFVTDVSYKHIAR